MALPSVEEMATRYGRPQPKSRDYTTPTHYLVYDRQDGTVLIPREWYDGREREIEARRAED